MATPLLRDIQNEIDNLAAKIYNSRLVEAEIVDELTDFAAYCIGTRNMKEELPGPKAIRFGPVSVKTIGQLIDELVIMNQRIWALIDKVIAGTATPEEAQMVQQYNAKRNEYVRELDSRFEQADIGAKVYASKI